MPVKARGLVIMPHRVDLLIAPMFLNLDSRQICFTYHYQSVLQCL